MNVWTAGAEIGTSGQHIDDGLLHRVGRRLKSWRVAVGLSQDLCEIRVSRKQIEDLKYLGDEDVLEPAATFSVLPRIALP